MSAIESETETPKAQTHKSPRYGPFRLWLFLGSLTLLSGTLCFTGLGYGLPHDSRPDEIPNIQVALSILSDVVGQGQNALNPKAFNYGSLYYYLLTACYWLYFSIGQIFPGLGNTNQWFNFEGFIAAYQMDPTPFHLVIRSISALSALLLSPLIFFTATDWQTAKGDREKSVSKLPWIAAVLMAFNYLVARNAHFGSPDTLMTLGILASLMMLWRFQQNTDDPKRLQWAGIAIGLASSIKIPALLMLLPLAWTCLSPHWHSEADHIEWKPAWSKFIRGAGWTFLAFALTSPWMILDIPGVLQWFSYESAFYGFTMRGLPIGWQFYPTFALPAGLGFLTYAMSFAGLILLIRETRRAETSHLKRSQNITLLLSLLAFILFLGPNMRIMTRYALPLVPFLLLLSAKACDWLLTNFLARIPQRYQHDTKPALAFFLLLNAALIAEPLAHGIQWDSLLLRGDTRQIAADWITRNIPSQTAIATGPRLGQIRLPLNYGQLFLETGPNNLSEPQSPSIQTINAYSKLINTYDANVLKQLDIRYVILYGGDLLFSSPAWEMRRYFELYRLTPVFHISPYKPNTQNLVSRSPAAIHEPMDALFIPYIGFDDSLFTGPEIFIFDLRQLEAETAKNPGSPK